MRALVIEDERRLAENIARGLRQGGGFAVDLSFDGEDGLYRAQDLIYDVIVLDLMLPLLSGEESLRKLRMNGCPCPVLVLTAKEGKGHLIAVLNSGADDYLAKPFDMGELVARVKTLIRRSQGHAAPRLTLDTLELNFSERSVRRSHKLLQLTPMEYRVLEYLLLRVGKVISKGELLEHLYDFSWEKFSNVIEVCAEKLITKVRLNCCTLARAWILLALPGDALNRSIRRNILVILLVAQGLLTAFCATALVVYVNKQRMAVVDAELGRRIGLLVAALQMDDQDPSKLVFTEPETPTHGDLYVIRGRGGSALAASRDLGAFPEGVLTTAAGGFSFTSRGEHYRGRVRRNIPIIDPDEENSTFSTPMVDIWYAVPLGDFERASRSIMLIAIAGSLFWVASSCLIAWFSVTRGMVPLAELARQAATITERSWALSLSSDVKTVSETRPLALALEALVARLSAAFQRERTFVNDAAHELKTVVAIQKSSLQVALQGDATASDYRSGLERALEDVDRLNALVHRMLSLAAIEGSDRARGYESVALEETILAACDQVAPVAAANSITIKTELYTHNYITSEEGLLQTLWVILLENSIRYSPPDCSVKITCSLVEQLATVVIEDPGAGIDADDLPHIFERFYRGDASRSRDTGGFGLGLAIAKAIVEKHLGQIEIKSNRGAGTVVRVTLPCGIILP